MPPLPHSLCAQHAQHDGDEGVIVQGLMDPVQFGGCLGTELELADNDKGGRAGQCAYLHTSYISGRITNVPYCEAQLTLNLTPHTSSSTLHLVLHLTPRPQPHTSHLILHLTSYTSSSTLHLILHLTPHTSSSTLHLVLNLTPYPQPLTSLLVLHLTPHTSPSTSHLILHASHTMPHLC